MTVLSDPRVLIVDDDPALLDILPRLLRLRIDGLEIDTADSARRALDKIAETDYDAVVTDIKMPGMDGLALLEEINKVRPGTPTLLISGHGEHDLALQALRGGAYDFIQKPVEREYLVAALRRAIDNRRLSRQVEVQNGALLAYAANLEQTVQERTGELVEVNERLKSAMTETHHRVKNSLQLISALLDIQISQHRQSIPSSELTRLASYVNTLADIHDLLTHESKNGAEAIMVSGKTILENLLQMMRKTVGNVEIRHDIQDVRLTPRQGTSLAFVVNELVTNGVKHGRSKVEVCLIAAESDVTLEVCDDGSGFPEGFDPSADSTTGLELVQKMVKWDLGGNISYSNRTNAGACVTVVIPQQDTVPAGQELCARAT